MKILPSIILVIIITLGVATIALSFRLANNYSENDVAACHVPGKSHVMAFQHNRVAPESVQANLCDKLTIINKDKKPRLIAFGVRDEHKSYDGISEKYLAQNQSFQVTLKRAGTFTFHDHLQEELEASFTVAE